jgi:hypothetical protein
MSHALKEMASPPMLATLVAFGGEHSLSDENRNTRIEEFGTGLMKIRASH